MRVIGVDPGLSQSAPTGVAVLDFDPDPRLVGCVTLEPVGAMNWAVRIALLGRTFSFLAKQYETGEQIVLGVEMSYIGVNPQSGLKLAAAVGAVLGAFATTFPTGAVYTLEPVKAKIALTSDARADKDMMVAAARRLFGRESVKSSHEADAVGNALAAEAAHRMAVIAQPKSTGAIEDLWPKDFPWPDGSGTPRNPLT